ncbi:MAG: hypothetical protein WD638_06890 [Nitriliruptoraceae bacterium]
MIRGRVGVIVALGVALGATVPGGTGAVATAEDAAPAQEQTVDDVLARATAANEELHYAASVTVVSLAVTGPSMASFEVQRGDDGVRVRRGAVEVGRGGGQGYLRSPTRLLKVTGVEPLPAQLDRLRSKYATNLGEAVRLDTGPALPVTLTEHRHDQRREVLYADAATGLIVRRETFDQHGEPVRLVAFTTLRPEPREGVGIEMPPGQGREVTEHTTEHGEVAGLRGAGFLIPETLPRGYGLLGAVEVPGERWPTLHLLYGDGLYTLSVFQQRGRLDQDEVAGARSVTTAAGGTVWRWPGSEPRRLVWGGGDVTFTALSDAPLDELLVVLEDLPVDPAPGVWDRIVRGLERMGSLLWPW